MNTNNAGLKSEILFMSAALSYEWGIARPLGGFESFDFLIKRDDKKCKSGGGKPRVRPIEVAGTENRPDNLRPQDDKERHGRKRPENNMPSRRGDVCKKLSSLSVAEKTGKGGKSRDRIADADDRKRH